jgi:hypothetical protein
MREFCKWKKIIKIWSKRNLTVIGNITAVKTQPLPKLNIFSWFIVENKILSHLHSVRNSFLTQVVFRAKINKFKHAGKQNVYNSYKLLTPFIPSFVKTILKSKRGTKDMYLLLIRNNIVSNGQKKWGFLLYQ